MGVNLRNLNFGAPAAERDINEGLDDYFVESDAFQRVSSGSKTVVLGNRGSGKSAIFKVMASRERQRGTIVLELAPEDYSYEMLSRIMTAESQGSWAKTGAYAVAWKHLLYIMIMKEITKKGAKLKTGAASDIYGFLRDNYSDVAENPIAHLVSYLKRLEGFKIGKYEAAFKSRELQRLYGLEELEPLLPKLDELCKRHPVRVLVDELDRGWDASEDAQAFVAGLFQACLAINGRLSGVTVSISLRQELYDSIPTLYEDTQKHRDLIEVLSWDEPALLEMLSNRIRHNYVALKELSDFDAWAAVFAETLEYRSAKSFNYMIDRTLYRPREIIQFCTQSVESALKQRAYAPINYAVISEAEAAYSDERTRDLSSEYRFQYPEILKVFEVFRGLTYSFDRDFLDQICLELVAGDTPVGNASSWVCDMDTDRLIETLWRIGFLRAQAVGGVKARRRSGSSYLGPHQISNLSLANIRRFQVHPMFRAFLGMKEPKTT